MATVTAGFELSITLADNGGNQSTLSWEADPATLTDFATAQTARDNLVADLLAVTDMVFVSSRLAQVQYEDSLAYPVAGIEAENKASITYLITGTRDKGNIKIPAPKIGLFVAPSGDSANVVDTQDTDLNNYLDNFRTTGGWYVSDGQHLQTVLKGKRISAKNNNG